VGLDLAKRMIQVHAVDSLGRVVAAKAVARNRFIEWCAQLPSGVLVAMESCGGAHHWARKLAAMGLQPRLIAGHFVGPYRMEGKRGKNDANDAAAVCEAASSEHAIRAYQRWINKRSWQCIGCVRATRKSVRPA